jgi:hypothetical protein
MFSFARGKESALFAGGLNLETQICYLLAKLDIFSAQLQKPMVESLVGSLVIVGGMVLAVLIDVPISFESQALSHDLLGGDRLAGA